MRTTRWYRNRTSRAATAAISVVALLGVCLSWGTSGSAGAQSTGVSFELQTVTGDFEVPNEELCQEGGGVAGIIDGPDAESDIFLCQNDLFMTDGTLNGASFSGSLQGNWIPIPLTADQLPPGVTKGTYTSCTRQIAPGDARVTTGTWNAASGSLSVDVDLGTGFRYIYNDDPVPSGACELNQVQCAVQLPGLKLTTDDPSAGSKRALVTDRSVDIPDWNGTGVPVTLFIQVDEETIEVWTLPSCDWAFGQPGATVDGQPATEEQLALLATAVVNDVPFCPDGQAGCQPYLGFLRAYGINVEGPGSVSINFEVTPGDPATTTSTGETQAATQPQFTG